MACQKYIQSEFSEMNFIILGNCTIFTFLRRKYDSDTTNNPQKIYSKPGGYLNLFGSNAWLYTESPITSIAKTTMPINNFSSDK